MDYPSSWSMPSAKGKSPVPRLMKRGGPPSPSKRQAVPTFIQGPLSDGHAVNNASTTSTSTPLIKAPVPQYSKPVGGVGGGLTSGASSISQSFDELVRSSPMPKLLMHQSKGSVSQNNTQVK
jgi:hypothetical protein